MKRLIILLCSFSSIVFSQPLDKKFTAFINPFIGTGGHGHTFPGATRPFSMVQLSPDTRIDGSWDGCSGYHFSDSLIYGFSHTHLSGTGVSDYGDIAFMPKLVAKPSEIPSLSMDFTTVFSHKNEKASAGYYSVNLENGVKVELSSTQRVGIQKYTAKSKGFLWIKLDLKHRDFLLHGRINLINKRSLNGLRVSKAWAENQKVYYHTEISKPYIENFIFKDSSGQHRLILGYMVKAGESILIKTGISSVDEAGALANLNAEMPHWDFERVKFESEEVWEDKMSKINIYTPNNTLKNNFYTALYHCMIHPSVLNDVTGKYRGRDGQIHAIDWDGDYYTVFSLWDTYRALHPLLNLIEPKISLDFMHTFLAQSKASKRLPMWELWSNETNCMIGMHSIPVILNTYYSKNMDLKLLEKLYDACVYEIETQRPDFKKYMKKGYLEVQDESESVSKTVEFSYDFYCLMKMAQILKKMEDEKRWEGYASGFMQLYNPKSGFLQARKNGQWLPNFDPYQVNNHHTEANAWQYSLPQHAEAMNWGSAKEMFLLDSIFKAKINTSGRTQADITGLIGQYAHGNEPSHHYLYEYAKKNPQAGAKLLGQVKDEFYLNQPHGLIGNEDCGQMSSWYVFSTLGFYPRPHSKQLLYGHFELDSARIQSEKRKINIYKDREATSVKNTIQALKQAKGKDSIFVKLINARSLSINDLLRNKKHAFCVFKKSLVQSPLNDRITEVKQYPKAPIVIPQRNGIFLRSIDNPENPSQIEYLLVDSLLNKNPQAFGGRINIFDNMISVPDNSYLYAWEKSLSDSKRNHIPYTIYWQKPRPYPYEVVYHCSLNSQYTGGGNKALVDKVFGDLDWRKGNWQGVQDQDFECVVDLKKKRKIQSVGIHALQDTRSWIFYPRQVQFFVSKDGQSFTALNAIQNKISELVDTSGVQWFRYTMDAKTKYRYVKVVAKNYGTLPIWHPGKGEDAFIFVDEIEVK